MYEILRMAFINIIVLQLDIIIHAHHHHSFHFIFLHFFTFSNQIMFNLIPPDANDPQGLMCRSAPNKQRMAFIFWYSFGNGFNRLQVVSYITKIYLRLALLPSLYLKTIMVSISAWKPVDKTTFILLQDITNNDKAFFAGVFRHVLFLSIDLKTRRLYISEKWENEIAV